MKIGTFDPYLGPIFGVRSGGGFGGLLAMIIIEKAYLRTWVSPRMGPKSGPQKGHLGTSGGGSTMYTGMTLCPVWIRTHFWTKSDLSFGPILGVGTPRLSHRNGPKKAVSYTHLTLPTICSV